MEARRTGPGIFRQTNAFAMNYGAVFGIYWLAGLACFVNSFRMPGASLGFMLVTLSAPAAGACLVVRFRRRVCGGVLPFSRGYLFSLLMYFYASLLQAAGTYVYFALMDGGSFFNGYIASLDSPAVKELFGADGAGTIAGGVTLAEIKEMASALQDLSPVAIAANVLDLSLFAGILISIPTALLTMRHAQTAK